MIAKWPGWLLGIAVVSCVVYNAAPAAWPARPPRHPVPPAAARSPGLAGHGKGRWVRDGAALDVWLDFTRADSGYSGSFGSDGLRVLDILFRDVRVDSEDVHWTIVGDATTSRFEGKLAGDRLSGTFRDGDAAGTFEVRRTDEPTTPPYSIERGGEVVRGDSGA